MAGNMGRLQYLGGDIGDAAVTAYNEQVKNHYGNHRSIYGHFAVSEHAVIGGNIYSNVLMNQILHPLGMRIAKPSDVEDAVRQEDFRIKPYAMDIGIFITGDSSFGEHETEHLLIQYIKERNPDARLPVVVPLSGLELCLENDRLHFTLLDDTYIHETDVFRHVESHRIMQCGRDFSAISITNYVPTENATNWVFHNGIFSGRFNHMSEPLYWETGEVQLFNDRRVIIEMPHSHHRVLITSLGKK